MGFFDFIKKETTQTKKQITVDSMVKSLEQIKNAPSLNPTPNDEYQDIRTFEVQWLESHYDFNSIEGINAIPISPNLKRPPTNGVTGDVYYYVRKKAYEHDEAGNAELAIACMRKSNALMKLQGYYKRQDCYGLVRLLARAGYVEEARTEKLLIDQDHASHMRAFDINRFRVACQEAADSGTDLIIMSVHGATCPECAKYQGRVFSISGKNKLFPKIPEVIASTGNVHDGCGHAFHPYTHGIDSPQLDYTLSVHPLQNKAYGKDIVTFSNRPFVDDRTEECKLAAISAREELRIKMEQEKYNEDHMIEYEFKRGIDIRNFRWLQEHFPDKCPKSSTGYRRMKTQNTKNFQILKQLAAELGREL